MAVFAASWLIPIAVFSFFIFYTYQNAYIEKSDNLIKNAVNVSGVLVMNEIDEAVTKMQKPTYEGEWESMFDKYAKGKVTRADYLTSIKASLISKFYMDDQIARYAFYMTGDESACCYSGKNGYSYEDYMTYVQPVVDEVMQKDSDYVEVYIIDNQIYLMRNLYTVKDYKKYGTLVVGINRSSLFQKIPLEESQNIRISVNGEAEYLTKGKHADEADEKKENVYDQLVQVNRGLTMGQRVTGITDRNYAGYAFYQEGNIQRWQMENCWNVQQDNRYPEYPRLEVMSNAGSNNTLTSDYWVLNASYVKVRNIQFGYTLPESVTRKFGSSGMRFYVSLDNPLTFKSYREGWDPENTSNDGQYYPTMSTYTFGLTLKF